MAVLVWDAPGTRLFETGVDRGVLYLADGTGVAWTGITGVDEEAIDTTTPVYMDGVKILDSQQLGDFSGTLRAFTYPDEFNLYAGVFHVGNGLFATNQAPKKFSLCYRTRIGNDSDGPSYGYKLHILYDVKVIPSEASYETHSDRIAPAEFSWAIRARPQSLPGFKPTAHIEIDSTEVNPYLLRAFEAILYGTANTPPRLMPLSEFSTYVDQWALIVITDNGDGTWTADGPDELVRMLDETSFQIDEANAVYTDADSYTISNTEA